MCYFGLLTIGYAKFAGAVEFTAFTNARMRRYRDGRDTASWRCRGRCRWFLALRDVYGPAFSRTWIATWVASVYRWNRCCTSYLRRYRRLNQAQGPQTSAAVRRCRSDCGTWLLRGSDGQRMNSGNETCFKSSKSAGYRELIGHEWKH